MTDFEEYESVTTVRGVDRSVIRIAVRIPNSSALWMVCMPGSVLEKEWDSHLTAKEARLSL
jgi:hypothetical protein